MSRSPRTFAIAFDSVKISIVWMDVVPPVRGRMAGIEIVVRRLGLSLEDPDGFLAALGPGERPSGPDPDPRAARR